MKSPLKSALVLLVKLMRNHSGKKKINVSVSSLNEKLMWELDSYAEEVFCFVLFCLNWFEVVVFSLSELLFYFLHQNTALSQYHHQYKLRLIFSSLLGSLYWRLPDMPSGPENPVNLSNHGVLLKIICHMLMVHMFLSLENLLSCYSAWVSVYC